MIYLSIIPIVILAYFLLISSHARQLFYFILWPLRLPVIVIGYPMIFILYVVLRTFDGRSVDGFLLGLANPSNGSFFYRVLKGIRLAWISRVETIHSFFSNSDDKHISSIYRTNTKHKDEQLKRIANNRK